MAKKGKNNFNTNVKQDIQAVKGQRAQSEQTAFQQAVAKGLRENAPPRDMQTVSPGETVKPADNLPAQNRDAQARYQGRALGDSSARHPPASSPSSTAHGRQMANTQPPLQGQDNVQDVFSRDAQAKAQQTIKERSLGHNQEPSGQNKEAKKTKEQVNER